MKNLFKFVVATILLSACGNHQVEQSGSEEFHVINMESCLENEREMKLSEIAESIEYLELKTPKEVVISYIRNILPVGDNWLISTVKGLYKFTRTGEFIKQIGRKGQGPDEYVNILGVDVDYERKEIVLADSQSLLFYDLDGNFLRKTSLNGFLFNIALSDSALWTCNLGLSEERFMATALNREGDTLATLPNPAYKQTRNTDGFYLADLYDFRETSRFDGTLYFQTRTSADTVYRVFGGHCSPYLYFDMGKYRIPMTYESWYSHKDFDREGSKYWRVSRMDEDDRYYYLTTMRQKKTNERRGHPDDVKYVVYDKSAGKGFMTTGEPNGQITDDFLGGPAFWPRWTTDEYYIDAVEWFDLSQEIEAGAYQLDPVFKSQYERWGEDTNQLLILCKKR